MNRHLLNIVIFLCMLICGCWNTNDSTPPKPPAPPTNPQVVIQGLNNDDRAVWYRTSMGSDLFPLAWIKAISLPPEGRGFLSEPDRFGFISDPESPGGLPIGLTVNRTPRGLGSALPMVGVNCAACHVGQITFKGQTMLILGAPNLFDLNAFYAELFQQASKDPAAIVKFLESTALTEAKENGQSTSTFLTGLGKLFKAKVGELNDDEAAFAAKVKTLFAKIATEIKAPQNWAQFSEDAKADLEQKLQNRHRVELDSLLTDLQTNNLAEGVLKEAVALKEKARGELDRLLLDVGFLQARVRYLQELNKLHQGEMQGKKIPEPGPGRIDAFDGIRDLLFSDDPVPPTAPVSYPHLWQVAQTYWFHWDGNTNSLMQRNIGQAVGMGAVFDPKSWSSTALPRNIAKLERILRKLQPPQWPYKMLGPIVKAKFDRGEILFKKLCVECHKIPAKPTTKPGTEAPLFATKEMDLGMLISLKDIGTDPNRVKNFAVHMGRDKDGAGGVPFADKLKEVAYKLTDQAFIDSQVSDEERAQMDRPENEVKWPVNNGYLARPLVACWATAPYLHNGSVPTLFDLLSPASERPKKFFVGYREFDPKKVGFISKMEDIPRMALGKGMKQFVTSTLVDGKEVPVDGNSNAGHEYGTKLSDDQKFDLIEYLKGT